MRAMVRKPGRLWDNLAPLGVERNDPRIEVATGDMTDAAAVGAAVSGCRLAVHAAATYSYQRRDRDAMREQNARGTTLVLDAAIGESCVGVVHVSSTAALIRKGATLDHRSPLGEPVGTYTASKVESERIARERQEGRRARHDREPRGHPRPARPLPRRDERRGPRTPARTVAGRRRGGMQWVDVRDTAEVVVAALDHPGKRFLVPGHNLPGPAGPAREVMGRRLPLPSLPAGVLAPTPLAGLPHRVVVPPGRRRGSPVPGARHLRRRLAHHRRARRRRPPGPGLAARHDPLDGRRRAPDAPAGRAGA